MSNRPKCVSPRPVIRDGVESVREGYVEEARWIEDFPIEGIKPKKRVPITKEFMATVVAAERRGDAPSSPEHEDFQTALYESVVRMVGMLAEKYSVTCIDETDDLMQDCFTRIWKKLDSYDPEKGRFSTWVYCVCKSVLNRKYRRSQRRRGIVISAGESIPTPRYEKHYERLLANEFADAVRELAAVFPEKRELVFEIFGNPDTEGYLPPRLIRIVESAKAVGVRSGEAKAFYSKVVRPFMRKRFKSERSNNE